MDQINQIFKQTILGSKFAQNRYPVKNRKTDHHHWILHISINLWTKFQSKPKILIFWIKFVKKGISRSKTEKVNTIAFYIFESWLHINNVEFWEKVYPKRVFSTENEKMIKIPIEFCIFELVWVLSFTLNKQV